MSDLRCRLTLISLTAALAIGCSEKPTEPRGSTSANDLPQSITGDMLSSNGDRYLQTASGGKIKNSAMQSILTRTVQQFARALKNPTLRNQVYTALRNSPYPEHKVHFGRFLRGNGKAVLRDIAAGAATSEEGVLRSLDSVVSLELYMPVKEHFARWNGGNDVIVASLLEDDDAPVAFSLAGKSVPVVKEQAPSTPTLVLVKVETDFDAPVQSSGGVGDFATCGEDCEPPCIGDGCGGNAGGGSSYGYTPGIYMTYLSLVDDGEDNFFRGDPEIEVMLIGRTAASGTNRVALADDAANESSTIAYKRFNHNGTLYTAGTSPPASFGVLVASEAALTRIRNLYPGTPRDSVPFNVTVWEDDLDRGVIHDPDNVWADVVFTTSLMIPAIQINLFQGREDPWAGVLFVGALLHLLSKDLLGDADEFLGTHVDRDEYRKRTGVLVPRTHVLMKGNKKMGEMNLVYRP